MAEPVTRGVRFVAVCPHKDCVPPVRVFLASEEAARKWRCPDHKQGLYVPPTPYKGGK